MGIKQNTEDAWLFLCLKSLCARSSPRPLRPARLHLCTLAPEDYGKTLNK